MLNELQFYNIDVEWLGSESEDYEGDASEQGDMAEIISRQNQDEQELSPMQQVFQMMGDDESRREEMRKIAEEEMGIEDYKVQPVTNTCMTDFFTFDDLGPDDIESEKVGVVNTGVRPEELPLNFYDNDDGFWDGYIRYKQRRADEAGYITKRPFFTH